MRAQDFPEQEADLQYLLEGSASATASSSSPSSSTGCLEPGPKAAAASAADAGPLVCSLCMLYGSELRDYVNLPDASRSSRRCCSCQQRDTRGSTPVLAQASMIRCGPSGNNTQRQDWVGPEDCCSLLRLAPLARNSPSRSL